MRTVNIHAAKTHLSRMIDEVAAGDEIVIARAGKPIARLVPLAPQTAGPQRILGLLEGKLNTSADFDAPLPDDVLDAFERG